jgi:CubicO group peptidase (beta-lactamase class C family)
VTVPSLLGRRLDRRIRAVQREARVPGLAAAVVRDGELAWFTGVGASDLTHPNEAPHRDTAYAIGSISKTFTAVMIMALRDEGRLRLDEPVATYLPEQPHAGVRVRELLAHASGLQREPSARAWDELRMPEPAELMAELGSIEQVLPARRRWHYSNLAYSLLGEVVARLDGRPWLDSLHARVLDPLRLRRTGLDPAGPRALGYYTHPFTDQVAAEPWIELAAFAPAGGLWSTVDELARWAGVLMAGHDGVIAADTVEEMTRPEIMADLDRWTVAWGLGLQLLRVGDRVLVGHSGGMPGFTSGLAVRRAERTAGIVLANVTTGVDALELAAELVTTVLDEWPPDAEPWRPGPAVPAELAPLVGRWWSEGSAFTFRVQAGRLEARLDSAPTDKAPAVFAPVGVDRFRTESGREEGELLQVERDGAGTVTRLNWAGYPFTREPQTFGQNQRVPD